MSASADRNVVFPRASVLMLRFDAPSGTRISGFDVRRRVSVSAGSGWAWNYTAFVDEVAFTDAHVRETCWSSSGCGQLDPAAPWTGAGPASALVLLIDCSSGPPSDCQPGGVAEMSIASAAVTLEDLSDPAFTGVPTGSALDSSRPLSGVVGASFSATDEGGGIAHAVLEVDGVAVASQVLGGPGCSLPYSHVVPCKPNASGSVSWDSRSVVNGRHSVRLLVYDATGENHAAVGPFSVRVKNSGESACQPSGIVVEAGWEGRARKTVRFRKRPRLRGRVLNSGGAPAAGAQVVAFDVATGRRLAATAAGARGRYALRVPATRSRRLRVGVKTGAASLACSRRLTLRVRAGLSLSARPRALRNGERVQLRGRLHGGAIPRNGKLVELQAFDGGRWRTFESVRSSKRGRFAAGYRFRRTFSPRTFRFRARVLREAGYPFARGTSRTVTVRVTP